MSDKTLELLPIGDEIKSELMALLVKFDSFRVGNNLSIIKKSSNDDNVVNQEVVKKEEKKISLLKRLFISEYE